MSAPNISGSWEYRSLLNNPTPNTPFNDLEFGEGVMTLTQNDGHVTGTLDMGGDYTMTLSGNVTSNGGQSYLNMVGKGVDGKPTAGWQYSYYAWIVPTWPNAIDQVPTLAGSVIRDVAHGAGSPAGFTATMYMVLQS